MTDAIEEAWSESRIDKPKKYSMPIWLTDEDFDYIVLALWKCRKNAGESKCTELYNRFKQIQDVAKNK
jgi:hypothetical protein